MTCPICGAPRIPGAAFCRDCGSSLSADNGSTHGGDSPPVLMTTTAAATAQMVGRTCPYCRFPLKEGGQVTECGSCRSVHHAECYDENGGCAVHGCLGAPRGVNAPTVGVSAALEDPTLAVPPPPAAAGMGRQPLTGVTAVAPPPPPPPSSFGTVAMPNVPPPPSKLPPVAGTHSSRWKIAAIALGVAIALGGAGAGLAVALSGKSTTTTRIVTQAAQTVTDSSSPVPDTTGDSSGQSTAGSAGSVPDSSSGSSQNGPPDSSTSGTSAGTEPPTTTVSTPGPTTILRRHLEALGGGDEARAFALMTPAYRAANPNWVTNREDAQPGINIASIGPSERTSSTTADVEVDFYARDSNPVAGSDTKCREFSGTAHMQKIDGNWRYEPSGNSFSAQVHDVSDPSCP